MVDALIAIFNLIFSVSFILTVITASTPLLLASSGELVTERAGVLNLGIEGMMIMGAACGFAGAYMSGSTLVGALCGILAGAALSSVFGFLTLGLAVNQVAAGLALTILGVGLSGLIGAGFVGEQIVQAPRLYLPVLTDLPVIGRILFGEDAFVYFSVMHWAIRCSGYGCWPCCSAAPAPAWAGRFCRSPIPRSLFRA
jgi:simple sugar transport system permease protein